MASMLSSRAAAQPDAHGDLMSKYKHLTKYEADTIIALYREGWGQRSIKRITGRSEPVIVKVLRGQHKHNRKRIMNGKRPGHELEIYKNE